MATNRPQGDLVGWRINTKRFRLKKTIEMSSLDKNPILLLPAWYSNQWPPSRSVVAFAPRLVHRLSHSATENWSDWNHHYKRAALYCSGCSGWQLEDRYSFKLIKEGRPLEWSMSRKEHVGSRTCREGNVSGGQYAGRYSVSSLSGWPESDRAVVKRHESAPYFSIHPDTTPIQWDCLQLLQIPYRLIQNGFSVNFLWHR